MPFRKIAIGSAVLFVVSNLSLVRHDTKGTRFAAPATESSPAVIVLRIMSCGSICSLYGVPVDVREGLATFSLQWSEDRFIVSLPTKTQAPLGAANYLLHLD